MSITTTPSMFVTARKLGKQIKTTPSMFVTACDASEVPMRFERHGDIERGVGSAYHTDTEREVIKPWRYEDPGDGRLLSVNKTVARCNFASKTGVAFFQTQRTPCFNIPELATAKEVWIKFDAFMYVPSDGTSVVLRCYDSTNGQTGLAIIPTRWTNTNCANYWINNTCAKRESRVFFGFHSIKIHFVSDATNGLMEVFFDNNIPYFTYKGNVNNGEAFSNLYVQSDSKHLLVSNLIISEREVDIHELVSYKAEPYRYTNIGTADGLTVKGTTVESTEYSRTGTAFYQTQKVGCFGVPMMDEVWIKFDLYHKEGQSRFRCYVNPNDIVGICLKNSTSNTITMFGSSNDNNSNADVSCIQANTIQTYIVHIASGWNAHKEIIEYWVDGVYTKGYNPSNVMPPLENLYLQSDDENNLFSNVVIASTKEALEEAQVGAFEIHADIQRTSARYWRYENPGIIEALTPSENMTKYGRNVRCNFASRTGTAFYITNVFSHIQVVQEKELWVKFDVYMGMQNRTGNSTDSFYVRCFDYENRTGINIRPHQFIALFVNNVQQVYYTPQLYGLHSIKLHYVSDKTNGLFEVYIDSNIMRYYRYKGNVCQGNPLKSFYFQSDDNRGLFSNIVISTVDPDINEIVPYNKEPYRYTNPGIVDELMNNGVVVKTNTKSRTGTAFYQPNWKVGINHAEMDEIWAKFDLYHEASARFWAEGGSVTWNGNTNSSKFRGTGLIIQNNTANTLRPCIEDYIWSLAKDIQANKIQTYILHLVSGADGGKVEAWVDGVKQFTEEQTNIVVPPFQGFLFNSSTDGNLFSNIIISDNREALNGNPFVLWVDILRQSMRNVDLYVDIMRCIQTAQERHYDVLRRSGLGARLYADTFRESIASIERHNDTLYQVSNPEEHHHDIDYEIENSAIRYEDSGDGTLFVPSYNLKKDLVRCNFASRTGIAFRVNDEEPVMELTNHALVSAEEIWIQFDVYGYESGNVSAFITDEDGYKNGVCIAFSESSSKGALWACCFENYLDSYKARDYVGWYGSEEISLIGFHTIKLHFALGNNTPIDVYIDNDETPSYSFLSSANSFDCIGFGADSGALLSNIIISNVEPSINDIIAYNEPIYKYVNLGTAEGLLVEGTTIQATAGESQTGTAFYQTQREKCFDVPFMDEVWFRFDLYHKGNGRFRCYANPSHNVGFTLSNATGKTLQIYEGDTSGGISDNVIKTNQLQTILFHAKSGATNGLIEIWVDDELVLSYTHPQSIAPLGDFYLQSDNENNLFSNLLVSNSQLVFGKDIEYHADTEYQIENDMYHIIDFHADVQRQIQKTEECHFDIRCFNDTGSNGLNVWRFEDPGDGSLGSFIGTSKNQAIMRCNGVSRTGIAMYDGSWDINIQSLDTKEIWVKFDAYAWTEASAIDTMVNCFVDSIDDNNEKMISRMYLRCASSGSVSTEITGRGFEYAMSTQSLGLHSYKVHCISNETNGLFEIYIDSDETPVYSYRGNINGGKVLYGIRLMSNYWVVLSNIIISELELSISENVSYTKPVYKYTNRGTAEGLLVEGTTVQTTTKSNTGVAFYQTQNVICFDTPYMDEVWVQFDVYHEGESAFVFRAIPKVNKASNSITLQLKPGTTDKVQVLIGGLVLGTTTIVPNTVQTYVIHYIPKTKGGTIHLSIDGKQKLSYLNFTTSGGSGFLTGCSLQSEDENNLFSNIIITDNEKLLGTGDAEIHADMLYQSSVDVQYHFDTYYVSGIISDVHADTERTLFRTLDGFGEGTATCKRIDLGAELNVGIGINIDGEGYAMIRTAGQDGIFTGWENYIPCERICRYIDVRLHVRMLITAATLTIDRRVVSLTISRHLTAGENIVPYGETFYNIPVVIPTVIGENVTVNVISKGKDSCVLKITDSSGNAVEGDVDILIRGW